MKITQTVTVTVVKWGFRLPVTSRAGVLSPTSDPYVTFAMFSLCHMDFTSKNVQYRLMSIVREHACVL